MHKLNLQHVVVLAYRDAEYLLLVALNKQFPFLVDVAAKRH